MFCSIGRVVGGADGIFADLCQIVRNSAYSLLYIVQNGIFCFLSGTLARMAGQDDLFLFVGDNALALSFAISYLF
jgi:hypothetical protein